MDTPAPPPQTLGESLAQVSRAKRWTIAVFCQVAVLVGIPLIQVYSFGRSFFTDVAWRLALQLALSAYLLLLFAAQSYAELFLPRTPVAVADKIVDVGIWGVGFCVIVMMEGFVFALQVEDARVLAGCTGFVAAFVFGVVAFWVWLAHTYGGDADEDAPTLPSAAADDIC